MNTQSFLEMGGYAAYVWPAYGISIVALIGLCAISWRWMRRVERQAASATQESTQ
jgi:heme exporter protein D